MNLKLLSCTPALGVILMDKADGPLIKVVQQISLPDEECNGHGSIPLKESSEKVVCVSQIKKNAVSVHWVSRDQGYG